MKAKLTDPAAAVKSSLEPTMTFALQESDAESGNDGLFRVVKFPGCAPKNLLLTQAMQQALTQAARAYQMTVTFQDFRRYQSCYSGDGDYDGWHSMKVACNFNFWKAGVN